MLFDNVEVLWTCQVLEKTSDEYTRLVDYVKNTHAATHQQYDLQVLDVSRVYFQRSFHFFM